MQFSNIIGQEALKKQLVQLYKQNRLSHALLFMGNEGYGALPLALAFAQYVVCENTGINPISSLFQVEEKNAASINDSCGHCAACLKSEQLAHPDIHFTYPVIPKKSGDKPLSTHYIKEWRSFIQQNAYGNLFDWLQFIGAENQQGNITAEECNEVIRQMNLKSFEAGYKILIIWMPELLGKEGNKLLKLIEEPPPKTLFLLVAENEELILPTLVSRCQLIKVPPIQDDAIAQALQQLSVAQAQAQQIASVVQGNFREAQWLIQQPANNWQQLLTDWLHILLNDEKTEQLKWIDMVASLGREKQKQFLRYIIHLLGDAIHVRIYPQPSNMFPEEKDTAIKINKITSVSQQQAIADELNKAIYYIERNAHAKMLFHALTIKLYHIIRHKTLILTAS